MIVYNVDRLLLELRAVAIFRHQDELDDLFRMAQFYVGMSPFISSMFACHCKAAYINFGVVGTPAAAFSIRSVESRRSCFGGADDLPCGGGFLGWPGASERGLLFSRDMAGEGQPASPQERSYLGVVSHFISGSDPIRVDLAHAAIDGG
jgi:hypothetical protein